MVAALEAFGVDVVQISCSLILEVALDIAVVSTLVDDPPSGDAAIQTRKDLLHLFSVRIDLLFEKVIWINATVFERSQQ